MSAESPLKDDMAALPRPNLSSVTANPRPTPQVPEALSASQSSGSEVVEETVGHSSQGQKRFATYMAGMVPPPSSRIKYDGLTFHVSTHWALFGVKRDYFLGGNF